MADPPQFPPWYQFLGINWHRALRGGAILALLSVAGWQAWIHWQARTLREMEVRARTFLEQDSLKEALLSARQILVRDPTNVEAVRIVATLAGKAGIPEAPFWYEQLVEMEPGVTANLEQWAAVSLKSGEWDLAREALDRVPDSEQNTEQYHALSGALALAQRRWDAALEHFRQAEALNPGNPSHALNRGVVAMMVLDDAGREQAWSNLVEQAHSPGATSSLFRSLVALSKSRADWGSALKFHKLFMATGEATFADLLEHLSLLEKNRDAALEEMLKQFGVIAARDPFSASLLIGWYNKHGLARLGWNWASQLPEDFRQTMPMPPALAESLVAQSDHQALEELLVGQHWGNLESLRLAYLAWHAKESGDVLAFLQFWSQAVDTAGTEGRRQWTLVEFSQAWGWHNQTEALCWKLAYQQDRFSERGLKLLHQIYHQRGDESKLLSVAERLRALKPSDRLASNNAAHFSLLLHQNETDAHRWALENYEAAPSNSLFRATYAFSLLRQGRTEEALAVVEGIPESVRSQPGMELWEGLILAAVEDHEAAGPKLKEALADPELLPAERRLAEKALAERPAPP